MTGWIDKGENKFHEFSWHVGRTWDCRMISLLWQELVGGGGIDKSPDRVFNGDSALSPIY